MANPTYVTTAAQQAIGTTASLSVPWPAGHAVGDIAVLVQETSGTREALPAPAGWTPIVPAVNDIVDLTGSRLLACWKRATSTTEPNVATNGGTDHSVAKIYTFRGAETNGSPINVAVGSSKPSTSTTATIPSITTTVAECLIVMIVGRGNDSNSTTHFGVPVNAGLTGLAEAGEAGAADAGGGGFTLGYGVKATAGATGTSTMTKIATTTDTYITFALMPPQTDPARTDPVPDARSQPTVMAADATTLSWNHTLGAASGNKRFLMVGVGYRIGNADITGVTYNGVAMTVLDAHRTTVGAAAVRMYYMNDATLPSAAGTYSIVVSSPSQKWHAGAISFTNVDQTLPYRAIRVKDHNATTLAPSPSLTENGRTNEWIVDLLCHYNAQAVTMAALTGRTQISNGLTTGGTAVTQVGSAMSDIDSNNAQQTLGWTPAAPPLYEWVQLSVRVVGAETVAGTNYPQALTATSVVATATFLRTISLTRSASSPVSASIVKAMSLSKALSATSFASANVARTIARFRTMAATSVANASIRRAIAVTKTASVTPSAALSSTRTLFRTLTANVVSAASMVRNIGLTRSAAVVSTGLLQRAGAFNRTLTSLSVTSASVQKGISVTKTATSVVSASLVKGSSVAKVLVASVVTSASMTRYTSRLRELGASVSLSASLFRLATLNRALTATSTVSASITRTIARLRTLSATSPVSAVMVAGRGVFRTLTASVNVTGALSAVVNYGTVVYEKTLTAVVSVSASLSSVIDTASAIYYRTLEATVTTSAVLNRNLTAFRSLVAQSPVSAALSRAAVLNRTLVANSTVLARLSRGLFKELTATSVVSSFLSMIDAAFQEIMGHLKPTVAKVENESVTQAHDSAGSTGATVNDSQTGAEVNE